MAIATAYETHREAVFPGCAAERYVPDMPRFGPARMERTMSKWIFVTASVLAGVAVFMFVCFQFIGSAHAEPGVFLGASGHKASGHVQVVKDGDVMNFLFNV